MDSLTWVRAMELAILATLPFRLMSATTSLVCKSLASAYAMNTQTDCRANTPVLARTNPSTRKATSTK